MNIVSYGENGVGGVLVYYIEEIDSSLAMMYYVQGQKYWYVKMYHGDQRASQEMYSEMYYPSYVADNQWHDGPLTFGLKYRVRMSTSSQAVLQIKIDNSN